MTLPVRTDALPRMLSAAGRWMVRPAPGAPLLLALGLLSAGGALAQPGYATAGRGPEQASAPFGLAVVWRQDLHAVYRNARFRITNAYAAAGSLLAVRNATGIHVFDARSGAILGRIPIDARYDVYSYAISSTGALAVGRLGGVDVYDRAGLAAPRHFRCRDACGPVLAAAFSRDGRMLAYQGARGRNDRRDGLGTVGVVDLKSGAELATLATSAARAFVAFSADGTELMAASTTSFDAEERHGIAIWSTRDWRLERSLPGSERKWRAIGPLADVPVAAAYAEPGRLTLRDLATDRELWSAPLVTPSAEDGRSVSASGMQLDLVALSPDGRAVISYETPAGRDPRRPIAGTLVIRRAVDGVVEALYDEVDVTDIAIAADGRTFSYSTRSTDAHALVARMPF